MSIVRILYYIHFMSIIVLIACIKNTLFQSIKTFLVSGSEFALRHLQLYPHHEVASISSLLEGTDPGFCEECVRGTVMQFNHETICSTFAQHIGTKVT